jgi:hypothetical protein
MRLQLSFLAPQASECRGKRLSFLAPQASECRGKRLSCYAAVVACLLATPAAWAQTEFVSKVQVYVDNDHTQVVSPLVRAQADVTPTLNVSAGYVADIVTSASVDIVTQASKTTIHDVRHQGSFGLTSTQGDWTLRGGYIYSTENDYASHNLAAGIERRLFENNTTVAVGYARSLDDVGRAGDRNFHRDLTVDELALTLTQNLTPSVALQVGYTFGAAEGYQASPYRFVPVIAQGGQRMGWVPETDPDERLRHAGVVGINLHVFEDSSLQLDYRLYRDTWDITSHTVQLRFLTNLTSTLELRLRNRFYTQSGAVFYSSHYGDFERYMTVDRELSPFWSELFGGKLGWRVARNVEAEAKCDFFYFSYADFPALPSRSGADLEAGLSLTY